MKQAISFAVLLVAISAVSITYHHDAAAHDQVTPCFATETMGLTPLRQLQLTFDWAARRGFDFVDNKFRVIWNG
jgi:hypothetical protein